MPLAFYPDYAKHGLKRDSGLEAYEFKYEVQIESQTPISHVSVPKNALITQKNDDRTSVKVECAKAGRNVSLYYRTADMLVPELVYAESAD